MNVYLEESFLCCDCYSDKEESKIEIPTFCFKDKYIN